MLKQPPSKRGRPKGSKNKNRSVSTAEHHSKQLAFFSSQETLSAKSILAISAAHSLKMPDFFISKGNPVPTPVFKTYWWFACERQNIFFNKIRNPAGPCWTNDLTLRRHKFTNTYRASDRVSQHLIRDVIHADKDSPFDVEDTFFRTILFKLFNKIETWNLLEDTLEAIRWKSYSFERYDQILSKAINAGETIYSAAYIMASPRLGHERKHSNHLRLLESMMKDRLPQRIHQQKINPRNAFELIRSYPGIGDFLAYQFVNDLDYGSVLETSKDDFVVPGPGALDGIAKCFSNIGDYTPSGVIEWACAQQEEAFGALGLNFLDLWGRSLHLIDCQNLFCEVDKYARVHHPDVKGRSDRVRIKQVYRPTQGAISFRYPKKWGLNEKIDADPGYENRSLPISR